MRLARLLAGYTRAALACFSKIITVTINSGQTQSGVIDLSQFVGLSGVQFPVLTAAESGDYFLQGSFDNQAFSRLAEARQVGSGYFRMPVGIGSLTYPMPTAFAYPPYMKLEAATAVAAQRTFTILARSWQY